MIIMVPRIDGGSLLSAVRRVLFDFCSQDEAESDRQGDDQPGGSGDAEVGLTRSCACTDAGCIVVDTSSSLGGFPESYRGSWR